MEANILIGLGNPGKQYAYTRHNVGFMFVDTYLSSRFGTDFTNSSIVDNRSNASAEILYYRQHQLLVIKPQTFMNRSGEAVKQVLSYYNFDLAKVFVAYDDLDLALGKFKLGSEKTPKAHNGVNSLKAHLPALSFQSIRIGIDSRGELAGKIKGEDYVLGEFTEEEKQRLQTTFAAISNLLNDHLDNL